MESQDQFCGHCGNPRVVGTGVCPHCGSTYRETYIGSVVQDPSQFTPPAGVSRSLAGMPGVAPPPLPFAGQVASNSTPFHPVTPAQPTPVSVPPAYRPPNIPSQIKSGRSRKIIIAQSIAIVLLLAVVLGFVFHSFPGINTALSNLSNSSPALGSTKLLATPGTIQKNMQLKTCGGCDDPVLVTIDSITIDPTNMVWSISLQDNTGAGGTPSFDDFTLEEPTGQKHQGTLGRSIYFLGAGQSQDTSATFPFVPYAGETYKLTVTIYAGSTVQFNPEYFTF